MWKKAVPYFKVLHGGTQEKIKTSDNRPPGRESNSGLEIRVRSTSV